MPERKTMKIRCKENPSIADVRFALGDGAVVIPQSTLKSLAGISLFVLVAEWVPVWFVPPGLFAGLFSYYLVTMAGIILGLIIFPSPRGERVTLYSLLSGMSCFDHLGRTLTVWLLVGAIFLFSGISLSIGGLRHGDMLLYFCLVLLIHSGLNLLPFSPFWTGRLLQESTVFRKMHPLTTEAIQVMICGFSLAVVTIIAFVTHSFWAWVLVGFHLLMLYVGLYHLQQLRNVYLIQEMVTSMCRMARAFR
jgi:hypothetical protein